MFCREHGFLSSMETDFNYLLHINVSKMIEDANMSGFLKAIYKVICSHMFDDCEIVNSILINESARLFVSILFCWLLCTTTHNDTYNGIAPNKALPTEITAVCRIRMSLALMKYCGSNGYMKDLALSYQYVQLLYILRYVDNTRHTIQHKNAYNSFFT